MKQSNKTGIILYGAGYSAIIVVTLLHILEVWEYTPYVFATAAAVTIAGRYLMLPRPDNFRVRRLNNMLAISAILLAASAHLMFLGKNIWAITLTIAAFIDIFTTFRYPNKEK